MIDTNNLVLLDKFIFLPLSSRIEDYESIFPGRYILHRENKQYGLDEEYVEFLPGGKIGDTNLDVRGFPCKGWSVKIHVGPQMATQNSFDVKGLSTMEIIYCDDILIYAIGHANMKHFFIRESYAKRFQSNDDILLYLCKIENAWVKKQVQLSFVTNSVDVFLDYREPLGFWIPVISAFIISGFLAQIEWWLWLSVIIVYPVTRFTFRTMLKMRRKVLIKRYKQAHPEDLLANSPTINAFDSRY